MDSLPPSLPPLQLASGGQIDHSSLCQPSTQKHNWLYERQCEGSSDPVSSFECLFPINVSFNNACTLERLFRRDDYRKNIVH